MCRKMMIIVAIAGVVLALGAPGQAANMHWDGGGTDYLWTNPANWDTNSGGTGGDPGAAPGTGDTAYFTSLGTGNVDIGSATIDAAVDVQGAADGYSFIGSGMLNGTLNYNTSGDNTFNVDVEPANNNAFNGIGSVSIGGAYDRQDTTFLKTTFNILNGGSAMANRFHLSDNAAFVDVKVGGLLDTRFVLEMTYDVTGVINVDGTLRVVGSSGSSYGLTMKNDNNNLIINDGGLVYGYVTLNVDAADTSDSKIDMEAGATLALKGGSAANLTLADFYALSKGSQGIDGTTMRVKDGASFTNFADMPGTAWYDLSYDADYKGTGNGYTVLTTVVPEPATMTMLAIGGLAMVRRRRA